MREVVAVDAESTFVTFFEVDDDLRLGQNLHGVGNRGDLLDRLGQLADVVSGDAAKDRPTDQDEPDGDRQAGHGKLDVDVEAPATSDGRRLHLTMMPVLRSPATQAVSDRSSAGASSLAPEDDVQRR